MSSFPTSSSMPGCWWRPDATPSSCRPSAIQRGPQGAFVYVVKADKSVTLRPVTIGVSQGGDTAVTSGLEAGEMVVVDGAETAREGSKVEVKEPGRDGKGRAETAVDTRKVKPDPKAFTTEDTEVHGESQSKVNGLDNSLYRPVSSCTLRS